MLASLVMAQAPVISRKKSQDQPTGTSNKPAQQKPATQPTTSRRPTTGVLTITSTPSDASVKLDNDYLGTTPITIRQQRPGTYTITFSAEGYETRTKEVVVTAGETTTCSATLVRKGTAAPTTPTTTTTTSMSSNIKEQTFNIKGVSFKMILVEGGKLSPYYIGETEVTQALWNTIMSDNPSTHKGDQLPVADVSWSECQDFISKLSSTLKIQLRLPSEAEWEYAAKGGSKGHGYTYPGSNNLDEVAWYYYNSGDKRISGEWDYSLATDNHNKPHAVKTKKPNELGLYDMAGNVHEWCHNAGDTSDGSHSMRGGGWSNDPSECAIRAREVKESSHTGWNTGLRLAMTPGATSITTTTSSSQPSFEGMTAEQIGKKGRELYDNDDYSGALPYVYEAAKQGYLDSEYIMGLMSYYGDGVVKDYEQAAYWFRKAADSGGIYSMNMLGTCYEFGRGVKQSWTDAVYWYRKSAEDDCGRAQDNLGLCYENGTGVAKDYKQAVYWYQKAADNDISSGQVHLGYCYFNGLGVDKDYDQAVYWYQKAADKGNSAAMNNLGVCYARGLGVAQNWEEAVKWYRKAAEAGSSTGQNNLGDRYYNGDGVVKDYEEAVKWYRKAAAQGNRAAQYNLGWCYYFGQGVAMDKAEAHRLMKLSADQGYDNAKKFIDEHTF